MKVLFGRLYIWLFTLVLILLSACASRPEPAPVSTVYRGPTYHDYERASWAEDTYTVRAGDTLYSIAFRANMDVRTIAQLNQLAEPYLLFPDQILQLKSPSQALKPTTDTVSNIAENQSVTVERAEPVVSYAQTRYGENVSEEAEVRTATTAGTVAIATPLPSVRPPQAQPSLPTPRPRERVIASADIRWQWPTSGPIEKRFSTREPMNTGLEFSGRRGDAVVAAAAGKVVYVGTALRGYGRLVIIKHNDDYITAYGHNDSVLVAEQQWVEAGQQIATMGSSGRDNVRLRFELRLRGNSVNPENYLPRSR
ncbi:peptidoglycan DD-metalloendopeptidase family protein [Aliidiomarina quisquiliarum]|uniref:peptidoglycan DD-metalloendopeptidase family protein n=1 Tax=Aliidiomarina quisquiliarum TaxID=2938947 RepID=UPI00208FE8C9|nr:peptidoglycan DD-metalloendopeptidase family protein [Aliidiomarina quisquiliarum]MCO4320597.1 peptidoglycan DD-metalloendopeptidase family protein [Aliidiomarina quisquiliarum]